MDVTSILFIVIVLIVTNLYYYIKPVHRVSYLLIISAAFIASYQIFFLVYTCIYILFNYWIALAISNNKNSSLFYWVGIFVNLLQLTLFRYLDIFIETTNTLLNVEFFMIPLGISFFTLQGIGYLINIKKGWEKPETKITHFALFILFFPKFLSGPIERSNRFLPQIRTPKEDSIENYFTGLRIFLFGIFKKVIIANGLGNLVTATYSNIDNTNEISVILTYLIQPLYLYFDFSGYSDIAIGISKMFGYNSTINFMRPFFSKNMSMFWQRFHISLSSWFNDYIFKQLNFRLRKLGNISSTICTFVVFSLFGIWHGNTLNFFLLGFLQASIINIEFFTRKLRNKYGKENKPALNWIFVYFFYSFSLILFYSQDLHAFSTFVSKLLSVPNLNLGLINRKEVLFSLAFAILFLIKELLIEKNIRVSLPRTRFLKYSFYYIMAIIIIYKLGSNNSFIYMNF